MNIVVIQGSPLKDDSTHQVARFLNAALQENSEVQLSYFDVAQIQAPNFAFEADFEAKEPLREAILAADGILVIVPEYNGRVPGAFKNLMDYYWKEFAKKAMATCTVSSGPFGGLNALHDLRSWMLYVGGIISPTKLLVSNVSNAFNEAGEPVDSHLASNWKPFLDDFLWLAHKLRD